MDRMIVIEHADGRRFAVSLEDYRGKPIDDAEHTYQQLGFRIVRWEDGAAYTPQPVVEEQAPARSARARGQDAG